MIGFAHRGGRGPYPENTLPAFARALRLGATGLESDVWLTADRVPVLSHERAVLGRRLAETPRAALPPWLPALADLFAACGSDFQLSLDVCDPDPTTGARIVEVAARHGDPARLYLCGAAQRARDWLAADARVSPVANVPSVLTGTRFAAHVRWLASVGVRAVNLRATRWTAGRVGAAHDAGLLAFGWGTHTGWQLRRLRRLGCDGAYCDHVERMVANSG